MESSHDEQVLAEEYSRSIQEKPATGLNEEVNNQDDTDLVATKHRTIPSEKLEDNLTPDESSDSSDQLIPAAHSKTNSENSSEDESHTSSVDETDPNELFNKSSDESDVSSHQENILMLEEEDILGLKEEPLPIKRIVGEKLRDELILRII